MLLLILVLLVVHMWVMPAALVPGWYLSIVDIWLLVGVAFSVVAVVLVSHNDHFACLCLVLLNSQSQSEGNMITVATTVVTTAATTTVTTTTVR